MSSSYPKPSPITLRITQIPSTWTSQKLCSILEESYATHDQLPGEHEGQNIVYCSLCLSGYNNAGNTGSLVATVTFTRTPKSFVDIPADGKYVVLEGVELLFDKHFLGFTTLYHPADIELDIVAVTGLGAHAFGSWKARGGEQMWLRDFLPSSIPKARILTYGYDSKVDSSINTASIDDYANEFLSALKGVRSSGKETRRPLVLIGHSLGGLVVKKALVLATHGDQLEQDIFRCSYGLIMFGVPNHGIEIDALRTMVQGHPNERLIGDLAPSSPLLRQLHDDFLEWFTLEDSIIVSFYETKVTKTVKEVSPGKWARAGDSILMVTKDSATYFGQHTVPSQCIPINQDHSEITKFASHSSSDYIKVQEWLFRFARDASNVVEGRFQSALRDTSQNSINEIRERMKTLLKPVDLSTEVLQLSTERCKGTGDWLLTDSDFTSWTTDPTKNTLWLRGCPGLGKTFLMSRVFDHIKETLWQYPVSYFFIKNRNGDPERRSLPCIGRTLLYQLLSRIVRSYPHDVRSCLQMVEQIPEDDTPLLFHTVFKKISRHFSRGFLLLDALDECDDEQGLHRIIETVGSGQFKIIVSSRNRAGRHLEGNRNFQVIDKPLSTAHMRGDLESFITNFTKSLDIRDFGTPEKAVEQILGSSDLFLASKFITRELAAGTLTGVDLRTVLEETPKDLTSIYQSALLQLKNSSRVTAVLQRRIFLWLLHARRPLKFNELAQAVSIPLSGEVSVPGLTLTSLDVLCVNLVDVRRTPGSTLDESVVELAHATVKDSILSYVWNTANPSPQLSDNSSCTSEILEVLLVYMMQVQKTKQLLHYAYQFWIIHLLDIKDLDQQRRKLLSRFLESAECYNWWDSPYSLDTIGSIEQRRNLRARFKVWIAKATQNDPSLTPHKGFMDALQAIKVETYKAAFGENHIDTLGAVSSLATTLFENWNLMEALELRRDLHDRCNATLDETSPFRLQEMRDLAQTYKMSGRWTSALETQEEVLAISNRVYGPQSQSSILASRDIARTHRFLVNLGQAESRQTAALDIARRVFGNHNLDTISLISDLAKTYQNQKRFDESEALFLEAIDSLKTVLHDDDLTTLCVQTEMAAMLTFAGRYMEACTLQTYVVESLERLQHPHYDKLLLAKSDLAWIHLFLGQADRAAELLKYVKQMRAECLGPGHLLVAYTSYQLCIALLCAGKWYRAAKAYGGLALGMATALSDVRHLSSLPEMNINRWAKVTINSSFSFSVPDVRSMRTGEGDGFRVLGDVPMEVIVALAKKYSFLDVKYERLTE